MEYEDYQNLGGTFKYSQALGRGIGLPSLMLRAHENLCFGSDQHINQLINHLVETNWRGFEDPCKEPNKIFERIILKQFIKTDHRWRKLRDPDWNFHKCLKSWKRRPPRNLDIIRTEAYQELKRTGWQYIATSNRMVFKKAETCLKIALDVDGFEQNYHETHFLYNNGPSHIGILGSDMKQLVVIGIPELYSHDPKYLWITRQFVEAQEYSGPEDYFDKVRGFVMKRFCILDVRRSNLLWDIHNKIFWITDPGIHSIQ